MNASFNIRFIRNFTLEPIEFWLKRELRQSGIEVDCQFGGFANAVDEINALSQAGTQDSADLVVLALGMEMTARDFGHTSWSAANACERHRMLVQAAVEKSITPLVINTVLPPLFSATGLAAISGLQSHNDRIDILNQDIKKLAAQHPGKVVLIDWVALARELGEKKTYDYRFWYSSGSPFAASFLTRYAAGLASVTRALTGKIRKCLILDCDNTLWGGIVGEDGRDGIRLSADTVPGAYFQTFQRSILDLFQRGIIIALCSKNNEADVFDILDNHADCVIHRGHLAAWRINWNDKAQSIAEIATELNIGRDALVFIDDSPHECELVRSIFPEILVLQTPMQYEELVHFLDRQHLFDTLVVTEEDVCRTQSYQQNRDREALFNTVTDLSDYKRKLGTQLTIRNTGPADIARITQLLQRTNQFNLTTRRHDQAEVTRMIADPDTLVIGAELEDRFGDLGMIGVAIVKRNDVHALIDTMLMSCRALGRDAELAFAGAIFNIIDQQWHSKQVFGEFIPSAKNSLVTDFWKQVGLVAIDGNAKPDKAILYGSPIELAALACHNKPAYITIKVLTDER